MHLTVPKINNQGYILLAIIVTCVLSLSKVILIFQLKHLSTTFNVEYISSEGDEEWSSLVPGDGIIYLGTTREPFMVSMIHQLSCLNIVHKHLVSQDRERTQGLARHCLNYIRQMVVCRNDANLEPFQYLSNKNPVDLSGIWECKDWEAVYDEIEKNQQAIQRGLL
ncbi:hypothetical protein BU17DRAFT_68837 [Hysterangium stoloniferum]|nr:hypothetical protein BU17DRAFT_68837 [Hysterangium stoloniferum]